MNSNAKKYLVLFQNYHTYRARPKPETLPSEPSQNLPRWHEPKQPRVTIMPYDLCISHSMSCSFRKSNLTQPNQMGSKPITPVPTLNTQFPITTILHTKNVLRKVLETKHMEE